MDDRPRSLTMLLSDAKDTSELMVDLAYAAVYFGDPSPGNEVEELEEELSALVTEMRTTCVLAARSRRDAEEMASLLQIIGAIERIGDNAVDISRVVTRQLGIPQALLVDLAAADEVSHQLTVAEGSAMAHRRLGDLELPVNTGMWVVAIRRRPEWIIDVQGAEVVRAGDVVFLRGPAEGIPGVRELAGVPPWERPRAADGPQQPELDQAIDTLVEMKNVSEAAVGLAYSALVLRDPMLAAEVAHLEGRLDEMRERLERWVLQAAESQSDQDQLLGLLHLGFAAEDIGDQAMQMVRVVEHGNDLQRVLNLALGESDEVVVRVPVVEEAAVAHRALRDLRLPTETGFHILAVRRSGRYLYRLRGPSVLEPGDELIATGPEEGRPHLAEMCGFLLIHDEDTGEDHLVRAASAEA